MKARKFMLCILIVMAFTLGISSMNVYAEETIVTTPVEATKSTDIKNENIELVDTTSILETSEEETEENIEDDADVAIDKKELKEEDTEDVKKVVKKEVKKVVKKEVKEKVEEEVNYTNAELRLLSCLIFAEAGNQSYKGKLAVANIVINRSNSNIFWHVDTIKEVIYDKKWSIQFSVIREGSSGISPMDRALNIYDTKKYPNDSSKENMSECIKATKAALNGENNIGSYLYFSANSSYFGQKYSNHVIIGGHIFYNTK